MQTMVGPYTITNASQFTHAWWSLLDLQCQAPYVAEGDGGFYWSDGVLIEWLPVALPDESEPREMPEVLTIFERYRHLPSLPVPTSVACDDQGTCVFTMEDGRVILVDIAYVEYLASKGLHFHALAGGSIRDPLKINSAEGVCVGLLMPLRPSDEPVECP